MMRHPHCLKNFVDQVLGMGSLSVVPPENYFRDTGL
jgi:hypothetical protein